MRQGKVRLKVRKGEGGGNLKVKVEPTLRSRWSQQKRTGWERFSKGGP